MEQSTRTSIFCVPLRDSTFSTAGLSSSSRQPAAGAAAKTAVPSTQPAQTVPPAVACSADPVTATGAGGVAEDAVTGAGGATDGTPVTLVDYGLSPPGVGYYVTVLVGLAASLAVVASTLPLLGRLTGTETARNE